ncbi:hypothetical protein LXL04_030533 [Taraxacum kok-saghyz]
MVLDPSECCRNLQERPKGENEEEGVENFLKARRKAVSFKVGAGSDLGFGSYRLWIPCAVETCTDTIHVVQNALESNYMMFMLNLKSKRKNG